MVLTVVNLVRVSAHLWANVQKCQAINERRRQAVFATTVLSIRWKRAMRKRGSNLSIIQRKSLV